jgi:hypothetical protein
MKIKTRERGSLYIIPLPQSGMEKSNQPKTDQIKT